MRAWHHAVRRDATRQDREGAHRLLGYINTDALIRFPFPSHDPWISRICPSALMPTLTMMMAYRDQESILTLTLTCGPLSSVLCRPGSEHRHPTSHLSLITLPSISGHPASHHLNQTHTTLRFHRHRIQQRRTRLLRCPRICRSLTLSPR